jgi:hypothetical protein
MERNGQCHCGSLRVVATGEPERVYLCHCKACQRRTGTAFHFGATYVKGNRVLNNWTIGVRRQRTCSPPIRRPGTAAVTVPLYQQT